MDQTPAHDFHNAELLALIPGGAHVVVDVGCSSGALAREYKRINPDTCYIGVEIEPAYAELARRHCDAVHVLDMDTVDQATLEGPLKAECWVFGDTLEHLRDPWRLLKAIRSSLPPHGCVVACIPNAQHWSMQGRINCGELFYEDQGLMDRTHLRWFTRLSIIELFRSCGFHIQQGAPRIGMGMPPEPIAAAIRTMATAVGADPDVALRDALPSQFVVRAIPV